MTAPRQRDWPAFADLPEWHDEAACKDSPSEWWFPKVGGQATKAKQVCWTQCNVRTACLDYAVTTNQKFGIWGGMTETQRRRWRKEEAA